MSDVMNLALLIKLLKMTSSSNDGEALIAIRKANDIVVRFTDWETLLRGKITIVEDPFNTPQTSRPKSDNGMRPAPPPPPPAQTQTQLRTRRAKPTSSTVPPSSAPSSSSTPPDISYTKNSNGAWCIRVAATRPQPHLGTLLDVTARNGTIRSVIIDSFIGVNSFGDSLYSFHNPPAPSLGDLA